MSIAKKFKKHSKESSSRVYFSCFETPVGEVVAVADDEAILMVSFENSKIFEVTIELLGEKLQCNFLEGNNEILSKFEEELYAYFEGKLKQFTVPIRTFGSDFQTEVWNKLMEMPYASTQTYGDIAKAMGRPSSHARAIGHACGANTHLIVIPCHRLVASNYKGGYNSGVDRKEWLLQHEKKHGT